jgi:flagellar hook protein FlgE
MTAIQSAIGGMNQAETQLNTTAVHIANLATNPPQDSVDLSTDMVNLLESSLNFAASASVVHVADQMQQSTLSILA